MIKFQFQIVASILSYVIPEKKPESFVTRNKLKRDISNLADYLLQMHRVKIKSMKSNNNSVSL